MRYKMKRIKKSVTIICLFSIACLLLPVHAKEVKTIKNIKKYENIVFFGDSITDFYPIEEIYGDLPVVNSGRAGYKTSDAMDQLDDMIYKYNPTSVYILLGTNDIIKDRPEDKENAIKNLKAIIKNIKKERKQTKIYVESILPVNRELDLSERAVERRNNDTIKEINQELKTYCKEKGYVYVDLYKELIDKDGNFSESYTKDGLHPNDLGYAVMTRVLLTYIYGLKK